ncbi:glycosyl hydrolase family 35 [Phlyctema vagabunda]|uniref:Beta-galactosidase n=1 Tax=Phlyctema vagabunda TaxID=108571 RepID=A0ABR4P2E8_9HELO
MRYLTLLLTVLSTVVSFTLCNALPGPSRLQLRQSDEQQIVTWDEYSLKIHGERILIICILGGCNPFCSIVYATYMRDVRLPVPSLWIDVLEKIKALGFNTVSFYVHWGLVEYAKDDFNFEGWLSLQPLFEAATKTGMYLIARPGPYINAETTGGGTPGWGTRVPGAWRTSNQTYIDAMEGYVRKVSQILAPAQITNGGPLILVQPENEYSYCFETPNCPVPWPQPAYMDILQGFMHDEGIVVPTITNEVQYTSSNYAPSSGVGEVDIRGYDNYPLTFICNATSTWPDGKLPTNFWEVNHNLSGGNPNSILEMQAGAHGRWGWFSPEDCANYIGSNFERVFYKNYISFSTMIFNLYMMFGGTNWGGIASPATITSYDYGSPIKENRLLTREKYTELKLLAQFLRVSPAYTTMRPVNQYPVNTVNGSYFSTNPALAVTQLADVVGNRTVFWIVRHAAYNSLANSTYDLRIPTSHGNLSIPRLGGEIHETAFIVPKITDIKVYGADLQNHTRISDVITINYRIGLSRTVVEIGDIQVVIVNRNEAFDFWVPEWDGGAAIIDFPYLIRSAVLKDETLHLRGDLNTTKADAEVFADAARITFNGHPVSHTTTSYGSLKFKWKADLVVTLPSLEDLEWKYIDSLPEVQQGYNDSAWPAADLLKTTNPRNLTTPTSLYSSDYGFHTNSILWRGHFVATGQEGNFKAEIQGGSAFCTSLWLDDKQLAYFPGIYNVAAKNLTVKIPNLDYGTPHVITIIQDHMGLEQNYGPGGDLHKIPRGILNYGFTSNISVYWKTTGNIGGEHFIDRARGPVNEGGLYAERQGYHQPGAPVSAWQALSPFLEMRTGIHFYSGLDVPLSFNLPNSTSIGDLRLLIFVNGYQFGKYASNLGPQTSFPVPEGIINHRGENTLSLSIWVMSDIAKLDSFYLEADGIIATSMYPTKQMPQLPWAFRKDAY